MSSASLRSRVSIRYRRGVLTAFVTRHLVAWDLVMGLLTVVYVAVAFTEDSAIGPQDIVIGILSAIFLAEFAARLYDSSDRGRYFRTHWLDLVTAVPVPGIPGLRVLRLLRLLRMARIGVILRRRLMAGEWSATALIWPTLLLFWLASAFALWLVEHDAAGATIKTFPDAMSAAFLTAATLGYGRLDTPVTLEGRLISAAIVFFALGLWGFASSNLVAMWLQSGRQKVNAELEALTREIQLLRERVEVLSPAAVAPSRSSKDAAEPEVEREAVATAVLG